nr:transcriptional regulator ATRX homolog [Aegilops tauschii subsp. strangulata]
MVQVQFAKDSAAKNQKDFGLNFNPGPSAPRPDGTREANDNRIGPFTNFDGPLSHIAAQRAVVEQSVEEADFDDAPSPPKQKKKKKKKKKKAKASKPSASAAPKASTKKSLKTASPESSVQSKDLSRVSKRTKKPLPKKATGQPLTPTAILRNEEDTIDLSSDEDLGDEKLVELKNKIDYEKAHFKKNMHKLSVADVQIFKKMLHDLKTEFHKKREEAKGSQERMKSYAQKCVQAHNEAEKRKALGCLGIDPRMAAKKSKKHAEANPDTARQGQPSIVFPASMTGSKPKVPSAASELKKTRQAEA